MCTCRWCRGPGWKLCWVLKTHRLHPKCLDRDGRNVLGSLAVSPPRQAGGMDTEPRAAPHPQVAGGRWGSHARPERSDGGCRSQASTHVEGVARHLQGSRSERRRTGTGGSSWEGATSSPPHQELGSAKGPLRGHPRAGESLLETFGERL